MADRGNPVSDTPDAPAKTAKKPLISASWIFFAVTALLYGAVFFYNADLFAKSWAFFAKSLKEILPVFGFVFVLMVVVNRYVTRDFVLKHLRGKGGLVWLYFILGGIVSTGPIYMWYPLLGDLRKNGVTNPQIACFLYNRSIKLAWLPVMAGYFGLTFVIVTTVLMVLLSLVQALIIWLVVGAGENA